MYVGALELDILLGDVRSLKEKRAMVKPVLAELRRYGVSAAETGEQDRYRRSMLGVTMASSAVDHVHEVLDTCERHVADLPELQLLAVRRRIFGPED
ncbi:MULTISPECIES: DUF503 domain-containing protein [Rhodococcus]|uniref:DUF503 domain-containing protein n=2 Tax=Rhodococcus TaxID=1827 RepID=A0A2S2BWU3_9NOCA|nr:MULTISPECIES: DUF503 domain-containing protein [Rhodococcus]AWK73115.1 hypothetical protein CBI38_17690 [Rhodococcus oxybenzonivorans]MCQ4119383.1 DUF503 domain-containing protein [Rhodococcus sp. FXJ9.536]MDV7244882.1 DUF503 domain-containing protein [Rhodococcus oxybenzonivorans]MDV7263681.1 DUF503 domain-containing protein [Rhodococcus oxybenzonivorans]MDV7275619.1 DUF503 domain-containing protein [Rhodococcus oxybenzonivorans]